MVAMLSQGCTCRDETGEVESAELHVCDWNIERSKFSGEDLSKGGKG
jgi:hypothetical protein